MLPGPTDGASWMSRPTPWPVPCSNASPRPTSDRLFRQTSSTSPPVTPASTASTPARWDSSTASYTSAHPRRRGVHRRRTCGSCRTGSRPPPPRSRRRPASPALDDPVARSGVRLGGVRPRRHDRLERTVLCSEPAHRHVEGERDLRLGVDSLRASARPPPARRRRYDAASSMRAISPSSFTTRSASTIPLVGHRLGRRQQLGPPASSEPRPRARLRARHAHRPTQRSGGRGPRSTSFCAGIRPTTDLDGCPRRPRHRAARPACVLYLPSVTRRAASRGDEQHAGRSGEPGQVPDVRSAPTSRQSSSSAAIRSRSCDAMSCRMTHRRITSASHRDVDRQTRPSGPALRARDRVGCRTDDASKRRSHPDRAP